MRRLHLAEQMKQGCLLKQIILKSSNFQSSFVSTKPEIELATSENKIDNDELEC
jgi:hypothetical protein